MTREENAKTIRRNESQLVRKVTTKFPKTLERPIIMADTKNRIITPKKKLEHMRFSRLANVLDYAYCKTKHSN